MRKMKKLLVAGVAVSMLASSVMCTSAMGLQDLFNAKFYAQANKDVAKAYGDNEDALYEHYLNWGMAEGRQMNPTLDVVEYRRVYGDLNRDFGADWDAYVNHYFTLGHDEKRFSGGYFDPMVYVEAYPDVKEAYGNDWKAIINHYLTHGIHEGRTAGVTLQ